DLRDLAARPLFPLSPTLGRLYHMAKRHPAAMRPRDESAHPVVKDALGKGYLDTGKPYPIHGFKTHEAANQGRLSVNRAGSHLGVSVAAWVADQYGEPCYRHCQDESAPHSVFFRLHSKNQARKHILHQTGGDPSKLKYNPFARREGPL